MNKLLRRLRYLRHSRQMETDLAEEMRFHQAMMAADLERSGMSSADASAAGRRAMGAMTQMREDSRGVWLWPWFESVAQDLAYTFRSLRRQPFFTFVAIVALAFGIGVNTSLFTVFNAVALRPWSVPEPARLVKVFNILKNPPRGSDRADGFAPTEARYLNTHARSMSGLFVTRGDGGLRSDAGKLRGEFVTGNYFDVLRVNMQRGRGFLNTDDNPDDPAPVAVVSHSFWQNRLGSDPSILGRTIEIESVVFTVVGLAPETFGGTSPERTDLWLPLSSMTLVQPNDLWVKKLLTDPTSCCLDVAGRLAPGVTREQARAELSLLSADFRRQYHEDSVGVLLSSTAILDKPSNRVGKIYAVFGLMFGGVMLVLLLACANVGNLLLARAAARRREIGVRLSLGASRARIVRQLLTESLALSVCAAAAGVALAWYLPAPLVRSAVGEVSFPLRPDLAVLGFTLAIAVVACVAFGLAPALHATRGSFSEAIKQRQSPSGGRLGLRGRLLAFQVAVSVILLVGAGLLMRGIQNARFQPLGFAVHDVASLNFEFPANTYEPARLSEFYTSLSERLDSLPIRGSVGFVAFEPLGGTYSFTNFHVEGRKDELIHYNQVSPGFFETLRIPLLSGRDFRSADLPNKVVILNQAAVDRWFHGQSPVGRILPGKDSREIIGVVANARTWGPDQVEPTMFTPVGPAMAPNLLVRGPSGSAASVAAIVKTMDSRIQTRITTLDENLDRWLSTYRIGAMVAGLLGLLALMLAAIGISGVFAYTVQQRRSEIGIRLALGARPAQVIAAIFRSAGISLAVGLTIGLIVAIAGSILLRPYIFGLSGLDPMTYLGVATVLATAGAAATWLPARRATRVDPIEALRQD